MIAFEYNYAGRGRGERTYIRTAPEEMKSPSHFKMQCICVADAFAIQYKIQYTAMIYSGELSEEYGLNKRETDIEREREREERRGVHLGTDVQPCTELFVSFRSVLNRCKYFIQLIRIIKHSMNS